MAKTIPYAQQSAMNIAENTRRILSELPDATMDFILSIQDTTQPLTRYAYARDIRLFLSYLRRENHLFADKELIAWDDADFAQVKARDLTMYLDFLSYYVDENDNSITNKELGKMRKLCSLRSFFKFLYRNGRVPSNVTELIELPKRHEKPILRLEIDEVARLLDAAEKGDNLTEGQLRFHDLTKKRDLAMLSLFLGTGIRVSECVGLDMQDLDFEMGGFLVTRKGGSQMILYFPEEVIPPLKEYLTQRRAIEAQEGHENALFLSLQKRRMSVRAVENMVKKYAAIAAPLKKRISPHKLRSTFGTNLYNETGDIYLVADVLGHSDINTTRRHYAAMDENRRRLAASKVKLRDEGAKDESDE